jgi:MerR family redox-sensitive transcriptional activator SoxR
VIVMERISEEKTIGQVARETNIEASTLRYYESIGLLNSPRRENGQRRYDEEATKHLKIIQVAKQAGFTLKEIKILLTDFSGDPPSAKWKKLAAEKMIEIDDQIARANGMKKVLQEGMDCDCLILDACVMLLNADPAKIG